MNATIATPPTMPAWNLTLRFCLELAALTGLGMGAWRLSPGPTRLATVAAVPLGAAAAWAVFNVVGDPSRSGSAPVEVPGWARLTLELGILLAAAVAFVIAGRPGIGIAYTVVVALHYAASVPRLQWLVTA